MKTNIPRSVSTVFANAGCILDKDIFGDVRIERLAELAGYNHFEAVGRITALWTMCFENGEYVVDDATIRAFLGPKGVEAIVGAEMGEGDYAKGGIRVRGAAHRFDALRALRERFRDRSESAQRAGRVRAAQAERIQGRFASKEPKQVSFPDAITEAITASITASITELAPVPYSPAPPSPTAEIVHPNILDDDHRKAVSSVWAYYLTRHETVIADGIRGGAPHPRPVGVGGDDLIDRLREMIVGGYPVTEAEGWCKHRIDVAEAESRRVEHTAWFTPLRLWDRRSFWRGVELSVEYARAPRAGRSRSRTATTSRQTETGTTSPQKTARDLARNAADPVTPAGAGDRPIGSTPDPVGRDRKPVPRQATIGRAKPLHPSQYEGGDIDMRTGKLHAWK